MKIAVIGTGISGMVAARLLHSRHALTVFEANDYVGGHTHTVPVDQAGNSYAIDTGFIVFNERTYPNFCRLLDRLGVASQASEMSFSVKSERTGLEYCGTSLNTVFAQRSNLFRPSFHRMLWDILRFNRESPGLLDDEQPEISLGAFLDQGRYSRPFREQYLIPMGAAIWSMSPTQMLEFPARYFVQFLRNHGLLTLTDRPIWRTITGGSWKYIESLTAPYRDQIRLNSPVQSVRRLDDTVEVTTAQGCERFDQVVFATHGDQALRLLHDATSLERDVLGAFTSSRNIAILHTDASVLPKRRLAWASWNYSLPATALDRPSLTYQMNILQRITSPEPFCVTLNREDAIRPDKILGKFVYEHPLYTSAAVASQRRHSQISGIAQRTHYCGAYWGYGFHEDGVKSAMTVAKAFGPGDLGRDDVL
jgi:predicted NAD/FAD-binding protein